MALSALRLRRTLSTLHRTLAASPAISPSSAPSSSVPQLHGQSPASLSQKWSPLVQSRAFRSSPTLLFSSRPSFGGGNKFDDEIGPDTILFEGCDYNHWLIVMDFPKDPRPSPEEMVRTYEETCAKGLNISVEEAKEKLYACSTTTYTGFQAIMTEEESKKFEGIPGVIFVLPDSYIDPQNKEYGGDKYIRGTIIPRPPPIQYGRQTGRYRDRNRSPDQPRYDRGGPMPNQQGNPSYGYQGHPQRGPMSNDLGNPSYGHQGPMQGGQVPNQQGNPLYGQQGPMQGGQVPNQHQGPMQGGQVPNQHQGPMQGGQVPNQQGSPLYGQQGPMQGGQVPNQQGSPLYGQQGPMQGGGRNYGPPSNYPSQQNYTPGLGERRDPTPTNAPSGGNPYQQGSYNQSGPGNFSVPEQRQWEQGDQKNYAPPRQQGGFREDFRNHGQGAGGDQGQGFFRQGVNSESVGQGTSGYGQSYPGYQGQNFSYGEQRNAHGQQANHPPVGQTRTDQGRY